MAEEFEADLNLDLTDEEKAELQAWSDDPMSGNSLEEIEEVQEDYRQKNAQETIKIVTKLTAEAPQFYPQETNLDNFLQEKADSFEESKLEEETEDEDEAIEEVKQPVTSGFRINIPK